MFYAILTDRCNSFTQATKEARRMEPLSITATCLGLVSTITKTSWAVIGFVKDVRAARSDLDGVSRELLSLKTVLELLADDVTESTNEFFPQTLQKQITGIVTNCTEVVIDIEQTLKKHEGSKLSKAAQWVAFGKSDVVKLQSSLEAHKSALEIALDMVTLTMAKEIKADTQELLNDTSAIREDTAQILAEIARLQEQLPRDVDRPNASGFMLQRYLDNLTSYAETTFDTLSDGEGEASGSENGSIRQKRSSSPRDNATIPEEDPGNALSSFQDMVRRLMGPDIRPGQLSGSAPGPSNNDPEMGLFPGADSEALNVYIVDEALKANTQFARPLAEYYEGDKERQSRTASRWIDEQPRFDKKNVKESQAQPSPLKPSSIFVPARQRYDGTEQDLSEGGAQKNPLLPTDESTSSGKKGLEQIKPLPLDPPKVTKEIPRKYQKLFRQTGISGKDISNQGPISPRQKLTSSFDDFDHRDDKPLRGVGIVQVSGFEDHGAANSQPSSIKVSSPAAESSSSVQSKPETEDATNRAKSLGHARRESVQARRARREEAREANVREEAKVDTGNASEISARLSGPMGTKPIFLKGLFSTSTTSSKPVHTICVEIIRALYLFEVKFTEVRGGFTCHYVGDAYPPHEPIVKFDIFIIKVPLLLLHGIQFKRLAGGALQYKAIQDQILRELRI
ncbi:hypothetical protein G7Y89_g13867 [Cudoniella acicularis]|uniref:non-specific serine/threonine protein kinase n=1 Tax=Cudoniella acicularis TaxID=354080 RepID=A0A8H4R8Z6_9HELO|nr:hypothetical protein G7Y89_g13867 [Cudoniella acicularis]